MTESKKEAATTKIICDVIIQPLLSVYAYEDNKWLGFHHGHSKMNDPQKEAYGCIIHGIQFFTGLANLAIWLPHLGNILREEQPQYLSVLFPSYLEENP